MKHLTLFFCSILILYSCKKNKEGYKNFESKILKIKQVGKNTFQHTSYLKTKNLGTVACNGMVYINGKDAIVFDTPTNNNASSELLKWIGDKNIKAIVVTHFHIDCLGGLNEFHSNGIKSYATNQTIKLATENNNLIIPQNTFDNEWQFQIGNNTVLAKYFGSGHTKDNIVGYIKNENTLFGGCLVKSLNAQKGNLKDANILEWTSSIEKIKDTYPNLKTIIPGHGKAGGKELLDYTSKLFKKDQKFIFFLHNRFLETHQLDDSHPEFGRTEYNEILSEFKKNGLKVISEKRKNNVNAREYAFKITNQIDSLIKNGTKPSNITIVGTSKGGYIAQYVSTLANNPDLNFVFIASYRDSDITNIPEINYCGNILTIYEKTDSYGVSAIERKKNSTCNIKNFKEIEINTGLKHGFLFKPLQEWMQPTINWAKGNYSQKN